MAFSGIRLRKAPTQKSLVGFLLILSLSLSLAFAETRVSDEPSAYDLLEKFNLPRGLLPLGVQSYLLRQDGSFDVYFSGDCEFKIRDKYLLRYKKKISGVVESGALKNLDGVSVKILFLWIGIGEVDRNGDQLSFYVGPLSASFGLQNFLESPRCRCGFNCAAAMVSDS